MLEKWVRDYWDVVSLVLVLLVLTGGLSHADERGYITFISSEDDQVYTVINGEVKQQTFGQKEISPSLYPSLSPDGRYIAYSSRTGGSFEILIKAINADEETQLTFDGKNYQPTWSPDGEKIAFRKDIRNKVDISEIHVIDVEGGDIVQLTEPDGDYSSPDWSPDGEEIVFGFMAQGNSPQIYIMNADGTSQRPLFESRNWAAEPEWSPTGRYIAYRGSVGIPPEALLHQIYIVNAADQQIIRVTDEALIYETPVWSPDGQEIAFAAGADRRELDIYILRLDDSRITQVTDERGTEFLPTWSPDGEHIAFVSIVDDGEADISRVARDGGKIVQLTDHPGKDRFPAWSPDGNQIAFIRNGDVYLMDVNGNRLAQLTFDGSNLFPAWSPDSSQIAHIYDDGNGDPPAIFIMDSDGQNSVKVYENRELEKQGLSWSPDGKKLIYIRIQDQGQRQRTRRQVGIFDLESQTEEISALEVEFPRWAQWSPSGERYILLAVPPFRSGRPGGIFVVNRDGTDRKLVFSAVDINGSKGGLSWSPDEKSLLFGGEDGYLFIVDVETGHRRVFMNSAHSPDWIDSSQAVRPGDKLIVTWGETKSQLFQNYPNPFNPDTWIPYQLGKDSAATITIYGSMGKSIRALALGHKESGYHIAHWDGRDDSGQPLASGIYFYVLRTNDGSSDTKKMVLIE